jgi:hypothetical protein
LPLDSFQSDTPINTDTTFDPAIYVLYQHLCGLYQKIRYIPPKQVSHDQEMALKIASIDTYQKLGCSLLSLELMYSIHTTDWNDMVVLEYDDLPSSSSEGQQSIPTVEEKNPVAVIAKPETINLGEPVSTQLKSEQSQLIDWGEPVSAPLKQASSQLIDWGEPVSAPLKQESAQLIDWGEPVSAVPVKTQEPQGIDWGEPVSTQLKSEKSQLIDWGEPVSAQAKADEPQSIDWGEPTQKPQEDDFWGSYNAPKPTADLDDEYELFKQSLAKDDTGSKKSSEENLQPADPPSPSIEPKIKTDYTASEAADIIYLFKKLKILKKVIMIRIFAVNST